MNPEQRLKALEDEFKVLKNEIKTVLLDIREHYLALENPFNHYAKVVGRPEPEIVATPEGQAEESKTKGRLAEKEVKDKPGEETKETAVNPPQDLKQHTSVTPKKMGLITIVGLSLWVERAVSRLGKAKVEQLIEVYDTAGHLPPRSKEVLMKLIRLSKAKNTVNEVDSRDYLPLLRELDNLMSEGSQFEASVLSILCDKEGQL